MTRTITKATAVILISVILFSSPVSAQTFSEQVGDPNTLTTGLSILIIGILGILTIGSIVLNSPIALLGLAGTFTFFLLAMLGFVNIRLFYIVSTLHALTLAATGVFSK